MTAAPQTGDVFAVPTGDGRAGVGQVLQTYLEHAYFLRRLSADGLSVSNR